jgi:hypothetical protein
MALSKRLRFEVMRRDKHTCRYCGASAPDVKLTVDHVVPRALGGGDEPANLVTACKDCNAGKTSSAPDQNVIDDASERALRWARAIQRAGDEAMEELEEKLNREDFYAEVIGMWSRCYHDRIPSDYRVSINQFLAAGLPEHIILDMAHIAATKPGVRQPGWSYFCGCCWTKIRQIQARAMEIVGGEF